MTKRKRSQQYKEYDAARKRKSYHKGQEIIRRFKIIKGCSNCGYKEHQAALEFNHIDRTTKKCTIGRIVHKAVLKNDTKGKALLKLELSKCEILCSNCHSIKTFEGKHWDTVR
jgi:hypothetical protein|tara:strand:+ start:114 stop:452 length:339 start_codon:yes stop_codon:yes gene_type:complete